MYSVAFSTDGRLVVSGSKDETVRLWDTATGTALQTLEGHSGWVTSVVFSPDARSVASGSDDETVRLWDTATGAPLQTLKGHSGAVSSVAFSSDGRSVVSGSDDHTVRLWDAATGALLQTLEGHSGSVDSVAFSPDGKVVDALLLSGNWVKEGEENLIWLHPDYRGGRMRSRMGIIVLTQSSGKILIMRFKKGPKAI